jgi:hypothetical protein
MTVVSLFDYSGEMVKPWAERGHECYCVDIKHSQYHTEGGIHYIPADLRSEDPAELVPDDADVVFAFPPCTNLAVSGARWFKQKGLEGLSDAIELVEVATKFCSEDTPYMVENPVSVLSSYWRDPDHIFHPYEYDGYTDSDERYSKKTCLWTGGGFVMPDTDAAEEFDDRIHKMPPSKERSEKRARTPRGFANAVCESNCTIRVMGADSA